MRCGRPPPLQNNAPDRFYTATRGVTGFGSLISVGPDLIERHGNRRQPWHNRPMNRSSRPAIRIYGHFPEASDLISVPEGVMWIV